MLEEFFGYLRENNTVGIRNYVGVISDMDNVNPIAKDIADHVQGTILITDLFGRKQMGINYELRFKTMAGLGRNPNLAAAIVVGLHKPSAVALADAISKSGKEVECVIYQEIGSTLKCMEQGVRAAVKLVKKCSATKGNVFPFSELKIGVECGGSDFSSGIAGNSAIGVASDKLMDAGGTVVLSETAEVMGAEHILAKRAVNQNIADKLYAAVDEINRLADIAGVPDIRKSNPSVDNQNGGITTLAEKSLGSIQKAGSKPLKDVLDYGDPIPVDSSGFYFMNAPGPACESMTAMAAGGVQMIVFNTGVGNPAAHPVTPTIKITGNPYTTEKSTDDLDVDVSHIISDGMSVEEAGKKIFDEMMAVANGKMTVSEILKTTQSAISIIGASF
jgi:altronate dehydratase large subunit